MIYQSTNLQYYQHIIEKLYSEGLAYRCTCTRKQIQATGGVYQNICRDKQHPAVNPHSIRIKVNQVVNIFDDCFQGRCEIPSVTSNEDFILKRKDGFFAYMLAVVIDDHKQQITHVIRGADLIETTIQQLYLFNVLKIEAPIYGHLPLAVNDQGLKLSKQNRAAPISNNNISESLWQALVFLQQNPPLSLRLEARDTLLEWAIQNWQPKAFAGNRQFLYQNI